MRPLRSFLYACAVCIRRSVCAYTYVRVTGLETHCFSEMFCCCLSVSVFLVITAIHSGKNHSGASCKVYVYIISMQCTICRRSKIHRESEGPGAGGRELFFRHVLGRRSSVPGVVQGGQGNTRQQSGLQSEQCNCWQHNTECVCSYPLGSHGELRMCGNLPQQQHGQCTFQHQCQM